MPRPSRSSRTGAPSTRERLLRAATVHFARAGFAGTTVDAIVATARVNKRMVYHYFGDKQHLYEEVLAEAYRSLEIEEVNLLGRDGRLEDLVAGIVRTYLRFLDEHPEFVRLLLWENLHRGVNLGRGRHPTKDAMLERLEQWLRAGMARGQIRDDLDARHLLISLIGLCQVYSSNRHTLSRALKLDLAAPPVREAAAQHIGRLLLDGIRARSDLAG